MPVLAALLTAIGECRASEPFAAVPLKSRITRVQPEEKVEWEAEGASGTITIKPSGWGTKVTLSVTCDPAAAAAAQGAAGEDAAESAAEADAVVVAAPEAAEPAVSDPEAGAIDFMYLLDRLEEALATGSRLPLTARIC